MRVLVTGSAGFIGSHLVQRLVQDGHSVIGLDNFANGLRSNVERFRGEYEFVEGDLRDEDTVRSVTKGAEVVFHQGALGSVPRSIADPKTSCDVNVIGTLNVLLSARDEGVRRVIYASSSSVYGDSIYSPKHEGLTPNPLSPYAVSKLAAEQICSVFPRVYGLETVSLRYFNVFGPFQNPISPYAAVIPRFLSAISKDTQPIVFGDGTQSRCFTYVDNVVQGNLLAADAENVSGEVINLAADKPVSVNDILWKIGDHLGITVVPRYEPPRIGDIRDSMADISRARSLLGFEVAVPFEEGLVRTVDAFWAAAA